MKVNEIFYSIEGEGIRAGLPCVFIRLYGCNLNCSYCDTRYSCDNGFYTDMSVDEIIDKVDSISCGCENVTVTGGEPLIQPGIDKLLIELKRRYEVNVETNGTIEPHINDILYTVDYKTPSSGMTDKMNSEAFKALDSGDVIKFVVGGKDDLVAAMEFWEELRSPAHVFVSPVFGKITPKEIVEFIKDHRLTTWRVQLQLHKFIWDPEERGV